MSITLNGTTGITTPGVTGLTTPVSAANGGTGLTSPGTNGNVLTSNGSAWVSSAPSGGVTSAVAGNGIAVSGATGAVTFSLGAPSAGSIGSYVIGGANANGTVTYGSTYSGVVTSDNGGGNPSWTIRSGTWMFLGALGVRGWCGTTYVIGLYLRVA